MGPAAARLMSVERVRETPPPQRTLHKDRMGGDLLLFTHLLVEVMFLKS